MGSLRASAVTALMVGLSGCSGLSQLQDTITKFDQGTHSAATAEVNFFRAVQTADCTNQFYANAYAWSLNASVNFDLSGKCTPTIITDDQIKIRQALMDAITLYADKIDTLATSDDNKTLDANSQKLATTLNTLAKQGGFSSLPVAAAVEAAIIGISEMALDQRRFSDIKTAASQMSGPLTDVVSALKTENTTFATGIASKIDGIELNLRAIVAATHGPRGQMSFFDVVEARRIMQSVNPFSPQPIAASAGAVDPKTDPQNVAQQLNAILDAVINANQAIASAGTGGIIAAVDDLIARARAAQTTQTALNK